MTSKLLICWTRNLLLEFQLSKTSTVSTSHSPLTVYECLSSSAAHGVFCSWASVQSVLILSVYLSAQFVGSRFLRDLSPSTGLKRVIDFQVFVFVLFLAFPL